MKLNIAEAFPIIRTHEGAPARRINAEMELRRSVMSCMLWESEFYESGKTIATRIADLVPQVKPEYVAGIAVEARSKMKLRHVPLLLVREMARHKSHRPYVRATLATVIQRADELAEFLAIYWKDGKQPIAKSVQRGLSDAFTKFSSYDLAKYNHDGPIKLRDVLFLSHAKPESEAQAATWKQLVDDTLPIPDTWEVAISATKDKRAEWTRLLQEGKLGALALLRNLRNMQDANVEANLIREALRNIKTERVLPFRFIAAIRYGKQFAPELDQAMLKCTAELPKLSGTTAVLVDVSGSMYGRPLSAKSDMDRSDAAAGLAILTREVCENPRVFTFSLKLEEVPTYRGLALANAVHTSQKHDATYLGKAIAQLSNSVKYDRLIVITDEQSHDTVPNPLPGTRGYVINVASNKNGIGYGPWMHIDGWSERVLDYINLYEQMGEK